MNLDLYLHVNLHVCVSACESCAVLCWRNLLPEICPYNLTATSLEEEAAVLCLHTDTAFCQLLTNPCHSVKAGRLCLGHIVKYEGSSSIPEAKLSLYRSLPWVTGPT